MFFEKSPTDGDVLLWTGLMAEAGMDIRPQAKEIDACYDQLNNQFYRRPDRVGIDKENIFSRDMLLGLLMIRWNIPLGISMTTLERFIQGCADKGYIFPPSMSTDNRHKMTPNMYWILSIMSFDVPWYYRITQRLAVASLRLSVPFTPPGYQLHLIAVQAFILKLWNQDISSIARALVNRQPQNPFFRYLAGDYTQAKILTASQYPNVDAKGKGDQWALERADSEEAWKDSMGWDAVFIHKLLEHV